MPATPSSAPTGLETMLPPLSFGLLCGLAAGYAFRVLGRMVLLVTGLIFLGVQALASQGFVHVDWLHLQAVTDPWLKSSGQNFGHWVSATLAHDLPFTGSFMTGFYFGLRRL